MARDLIERFLGKIEVDGECWRYTGQIGRDGYGQFKVACRNVAAHRFSFAMEHEIPPGLFVLHRCDNRACVRPTHLFLGTHTDNMRDMVAKGRYRVRTVIASDLVPGLRARIAQGETQTTIAAEFGVTQSSISRAVNGMRSRAARARVAGARQ